MTSKYIYSSYLKKLIPVKDFDTEKYTEKFILEVKNHQCIWDSNSKSYNLKCVRNRETKRKAWEEIARTFTPNFDFLRPEDRQKKVERLSKKWANIKKYYTDEVRKTDNNPPKKRQRRYHHLLTFLDESVKKPRVQRIKEFKNITKEEVIPDNSSDSEAGELHIVEDIDELKHLSPESGDHPVPPTLLNDKNNNPEVHVKIEPDEKKCNVWKSILVPPVIKNENPNTEMVKKNPEIMKLLKETRELPPVNDNIFYSPTSTPGADNNLSRALSEDEIAESCKTFLLSLLPEVMSLNVQQGLQFRLGIVELLKDIKLKERELHLKLIPDYYKKIFNNG